jgi:hypothetical protein
LEEAEHRNRDCYTFDNEDPDVRKYRRVRGLAVSTEVLRENRCDSHSDSYETVLINPAPNDIEPRKPTPRCLPRSPLSPTALFEQAHWKDPLFRCNATEIILLVMQIRGNVVAEKGKERGDSEGFVAVGYYLEVDCMPVELQ